MKPFGSVFIALFFLISVFQRVVHSEPLDSALQANAIEFMRKFGYIDKAGGEVQLLLAPDKKGEEKFRKAIKEVQKFGGISETGVLDPETIKLMASKRCGVPDIVEDSREYEEDNETQESGAFHHNEHHHHHHHHHHHNHHHESHEHELNETLRRKKRYIVAATTWKKRHLTYSLGKGAARLGREELLATFEEALDTWARYGRLSFIPISDPRASDITFSFGTRDHGDPYPFDGRGNVLAHAFFPGSSRELEGSVHFDDDEDWRIEKGQYEEGVDLYTVALHELGHALGLSHSPNFGSVMNPYYRGSTRDLGEDDIRAMYNLYAAKRLDDDNYSASEIPRRPPRTRPSTTTHRTFVTSRPVEEPTTKRTIHQQGSYDVPRPSEGCFGSYDTVSLIRNELFIIKDKLLWRLDRPGKILAGYPVEDFHRFFYKLPKSVQRIDAIYQRDHDSKIVIFSGRQYWVFDGNDFVDSPRSIMEYGLPHYIEKVDAAGSRNNTAYLFTDKMFWKYNDLEKRPISASPRPITDWGFNSPIDAAMAYKDGLIYFFKDDYFYTYDEMRKRIKLNPTKASDYWLGC